MAQQTSSSANTSDVVPRFYNYWGGEHGWQPIFFISIAIGLAIIVLALMYSQAVRDDKLKGWCMKELLQLVYSIFILIAALAIVSSLTATVFIMSQVSFADAAQARAWQGYVYARCSPGINPLYDRPCHIRLAEDYLQILASATESQARTVLNYNSLLAEASSIGLSFRGMPDPAGYLDIAPFAGFSIPLETLGFLFDIANKSLMTLRFQQFLLEYLHLAFFPLFLSLGLFFRSLYFTRRLGGLLIAIALSAYIVYPMMYVFFSGMLFSFTGPWPDPGQQRLDTYSEKVGASLFPISVDLGGIVVTPQKPVAATSEYGESVTVGGFTGVKGKYSNNGYIEPWEECNEYPFSNRSNFMGDIGKPNTQPFGCPPSNAQGQILPGRENDLYCNANNAKCTNDPTHGYARKSDRVYDQTTGQYITPFREQFMDPTTRNTLIKSSAELATNFCSDPNPTAATNADNRRLMLGAAKQWYEILLQGIGGALKIAFMHDELLGFNGVIDNLAKILVFSLLCPFISIMVMLASIKVLSPLLGGDTEIAGLTRLI